MEDHADRQSRRRPASYSDQFRTRYRDFACLYWLRFGYFISAAHGQGTFRPHQVAKPGSMHQRLLADEAPFVYPDLLTHSDRRIVEEIPSHVAALHRTAKLCVVP